MYKAIVEFYDLTDGDRKYRVGDVFPRPDLKVSEERIADLLGSSNKLGTPVIEKIGESKAETVENVGGHVTREELEKMKFFSVKALATKNGIDVEGKNSAELKTEIIKKLNL